MVPEISHRCSACGASIRDFGERALFCPECGQPLVTEEIAETNTVNETSPEKNEIQAETVIARADDSDNQIEKERDGTGAILLNAFNILMFRSGHKNAEDRIRPTR